MTINQWLTCSTRQFQRSTQVNNPRLEAELILANILGTERSALHAHPEKILTKNQVDLAEQWLKQRLSGYPLAYLAGYKEFYGFDFKVTPEVLIPRPESERIIESVLRFAKTLDQPRILDLGAGSGALGISLFLSLQNEQQKCSISLADISRNALAIAKMNAQRFKVPADFIESDLLQNIHNQYDIILANLPYVDENWSHNQNIKHEPSLALFAKDNGLQVIKRLITSLTLDKSHCLSLKGRLFLEFDPCQKIPIHNYLTQHGLIVAESQDFLTIAGWGTQSASR